MKPIVATYYLRRKDDLNFICSKFEATNVDKHLDGCCYSAVGWDLDYNVVDWT